MYREDTETLNILNIEFPDQEPRLDLFSEQPFEMLKIIMDKFHDTDKEPANLKTYSEDASELRLVNIRMKAAYDEFILPTLITINEYVTRYGSLLVRVKVYDRNSSGRFKYKVDVAIHNHHDGKMSISLDPVRVFIGQRDYLGAVYSFLLDLGNNMYVFIGNETYSFNIKKGLEITEYSSEFSEPYAVDNEGNYYLMIEKVIVTNKERRIKRPYDYYYQPPVDSCYVEEMYVKEEDANFLIPTPPDRRNKEYYDIITRGGTYKLYHMDIEEREITEEEFLDCDYNQPSSRLQFPPFDNVILIDLET